MQTMFFSLKKYINYALKSKHFKGHGLHSPFIYDFVCKVFNQDHYYKPIDIQNFQDELVFDKRKILLEDYGAGSKIHKQNERKIGSIAQSASIRNKYGKVLFKTALHYNCIKIIETGTCLGLSAMYLAAASNKSQVISIEADKELAKIAKENFARMYFTNIEIKIGKFQQKLEEALKETGTPDLIFFDADHRCNSTLNAFEIALKYSSPNTIMIFDDIYWSSDMEKAWLEIQKHPRVKACIDIFQFGIVFFREEIFEAQYFRVRY